MHDFSAPARSVPAVAGAKPESMTTAALGRLLDVAARQVDAQRAVLCDAEGVAIAIHDAGQGDQGLSDLSDLCRAAVIAAQPVFRSDAPSPPGSAPFGLALSIPVTGHAGPPLGALAVESKTSKAWTTRDIAVLRGLGIVMARELARGEMAAEHPGERADAEPCAVA